VDYRETEVETTLAKDTKSFEDALKVLWDKVKSASETIAAVKSEKQAVYERLLSLGNQIEVLRGELQAKELEIKRLRAELAQSTNQSGAFEFSNEEREILRLRIRELIAKINSHL